MREKKRIVAAFDFDGTLTTKDTFPEFITFVYGKRRLYTGLLLHSPCLLLMKLRLYPNWKAKQRVFSWFFRGVPYAQFAQWGRDFATVIEGMKRDATLDCLRQKREEGADVYVISASIYEWVYPFCSQIGAKDVLATEVEIDDKGLLTGRFASPNCYGREKVCRLLAAEPPRSEYFLYAYGDSRGDRELIAYADKGTYI